MINSEYTNYEENPIDIKDVSTIRIKPGKKRREIKDLASDLVYGEVPNGEGTGLEGIETLSIKSYPKYDNREHRILHRAYNKYKAKKEQQEQEQEFENAPLEIVNTWDPEKQQRWFTAQMNKGARTVLPSVLGVATLPWTISAAVTAPITTALSIGGGLLGSKIGGDYGRKIDDRRHGYTNNELLYGTIGGLVGGSLGAGVGNYTGNRITFTSGNRYRDANSWKWGNEFNEYGRKLRNKGYEPMKFQEWVKTYKLSPLEKLAADHRVIGTTQYINDGYSNWFRSISPKSKILGTAFGIVSRLNPPSKETLTNWSNRSLLNRWITEGDGLITQIYPKQKNHIDLNTPRTFYSTKNPYFAEKGIRPGESGLMWYSKNRGYFVDGINGDPIPPHVTLKVNPKGLSLGRDPLHPHIPIEKSPVVVSEGILPYQNIQSAVEYDPLLKTFVRYDFKNPSSNLGVTPKGMFAFYERSQTPFKTAKYAGSPGTYNGKTVPAWQLPKGQRNQATYVRSPEQQFVSDYLEYRGEPFELKGDWYSWKPIEKDNPEAYNLMDNFIKSLPEPDPKFLVDDRTIFGYRNYLRTHGVMYEFRFSDTDLKKLLSYEYKILSNSATGKLKNTLLFHSSPEWFDSFDLRYTGKNMENSGTMGPGNYFSTEGTLYGYTSHEFLGRRSRAINNTQPYIITGITSTPNGRVMQNKGLLPEIIHKYRVRDHFGGRYDLDPEFSTKLQQQISKTPLHDNKAYVAPSTSNGIPWLYKQGVFRYGESMPLFGGEVMIRRNSGIKSLYPHPSRFVKNADGTVTLKPADWSDIRVNYKEGGKLK